MSTSFRSANTVNKTALFKLFKYAYIFYLTHNKKNKTFPSENDTSTSHLSFFIDLSYILGKVVLGR